ncbi:unnamed protein product, partial [Arctia plantaginis]
MQPGRTTFRIALVKRINNASEAIEFLLALEQFDRWGNKRIVLDCNAKNAKSILVEHVRKVQLGRRTYHYMLSGLAETALMYDGVQVLMDALGRLWRKKPDAFRSALRRAAGQANSTKVIDCNPGKSWVVPFEHGDKISRLIKKTDIEGLTGNISFNDEGHRHNFTLHVVEMTVQSAMLKVATWTDAHGLQIATPKYVQLRSPASYETNRTYLMTSIIQEPYLMLKQGDFGQKEEFYGFCKDLMDIISKKLGIKYEIRLSKEGKYVNDATPEIYTGVIGDIMRK